MYFVNHVSSSCDQLCFFMSLANKNEKASLWATHARKLSDTDSIILLVFSYCVLRKWCLGARSDEKLSEK